IAFSFFLQTSVSFSLGISALLFVMMGSALLANGYSLEADLMFARQENMLRFGAYLAFAIIILYIGRRYYREVVLSALGRRRGQEAPEYATWAARGLGLAMIIAVALLHGAGLGWLYCILFVLLMLVIFLVMARMVTETGVFFIQPWWSPVGVIAGFMGFNALGPTAFATLAIASAILICDPREIVMPFISNGLFVSERAGAIVPNKVAPWIAIMLVGGFVAAGAMTLWLQYNYSASQMGNTWGTDDVPQLAFNPLSRNLADAAAHGTLADATTAGFWQRLLAIHPPAGNLLWFSIGLILVLVTSVARLRLPWWPLHPVAFLVWGTYPGWEFAFSFLLGSGIKASVVGISGTKGYHSVKPLMVGVIAGELLMGLFWMLVCAAYFFIEHKRPVNFMIFPA
ncbi:MAG TPA: DUF6785 family protein, partial [Polyangiaceae bacterium]